jgi:hypothetical protein
VIASAFSLMAFQSSKLPIAAPKQLIGYLSAGFFDRSTIGLAIQSP